MSRTGKTAILTVAAPGAGDHVKGQNPTHDHDNAETDASAAELIKAHEAKYHGAVVPPVEPPPADAKPTITGIAVSAVTQTDGRISWSLSEPSTGQIEYGKTTGYGSLSTLEPKLLPSHSQVLTGLTGDTTYHFRVHSKDSAGQEVTSSDASFKTAAVAPIPGPEPVPPAGKTANVADIPSLKAALKDDSNDTILVAAKSYSVQGAGFQGSTSLWIDQKRTRPVLVKPATAGGKIVFDAGSGYGHMSFEDGGANQTWEDVTLVGGTITQSGAIVVGGYAGLPGAHHITLRRFTIGPTVKGSGTTHDGEVTNHAFYGSHAVGGPHDFVLEDWDIDCGSTLDSGFHFYHGESGNVNCWNFTIRRFRIRNAEKAIIIWEPTCHDLLFDTGVITNTTDYALSYNHPASKITMRNVQSTGSGQGGIEDYGNRSGLTIEPSCSFQ